MRIAICSALFLAHMALQARQPTLDQSDHNLADLMSLPIPSELVAARSAPVFAWLELQAGARNIFVYEKGKPRQRTSYRGDSGQAMQQLTLSADGTQLAFVRGGDPDADGFSANPSSERLGNEQAVYLLEVPGETAPRKIADGHSPVFSPDSKQLIVQHGAQLHCYRLTDQAPSGDSCTAPLTRLRGTQHSVQYSPTGDEISFLSDRGDRVFVATLNLASSKVQWRNPDFNRDVTLAYSPDASRLAWIRMQGAKTGETLDVTRAEPMQIVETSRADLATDLARMRHQSGPKAASYALVRFQTPLQYDAANRLIFASEEDGWMRLYALAPGSQAPSALSPKACEVEDFDLAGTTLIYSANCGRTQPKNPADLGLNRRDLFRVDTAIGKSTQISPSAIPLSVSAKLANSGKLVAYLSSTATRPLQVYIEDCVPRCRAGAAAVSSALDDKQIGALNSLQAPKQVTFRASDGLLIHGQLFGATESTPNSKRPAIVFVHGGPMRQMLPAFHFMPYYHRDYAMNHYLASRGYVVLSVNFRAGTGYGQAFRLDPKQGPRGNSEYQDVLAGYRYLSALPEVDAKRIGIYGGSYGGLLTAQALARDSDKFKAGVDLHGVHDWRLAAIQENGASWGLTAAEHQLAFESSPIAAISTWTSPCLFIHGDDDRAVPFNQSTDLITRLRDQGVETESLVFVDEEHDFLLHRSWLRIYQATVDFFDRRL